MVNTPIDLDYLHDGSCEPPEESESLTKCDEWCGHPRESDKCWCKPTPQK